MDGTNRTNGTNTTDEFLDGQPWVIAENSGLGATRVPPAATRAGPPQAQRPYLGAAEAAEAARAAKAAEAASTGAFRVDRVKIKNVEALKS